MNTIKHTNKMTMKEILEETGYLQRFEQQGDPDILLRLQNLRNELKYRLSIEEQ